MANGRPSWANDVARIEARLLAARRQRMVDQAWAVVIGLLAAVAVGLLVMHFVGCGGGASDGCTPELIRCAGQRLEVCNADRRWDLITDCAGVTPGPWTCCIEQETCTPLAVCGAGTDQTADAGNMIDGGGDGGR